MALHSGIDMVAVLTGGWFTYTYGAADTDNTMDLCLSGGLFEDVPVDSDNWTDRLSWVLDLLLLRR